ncbi:6142_t:CDS:2, partial [Cetraspora pellucida]
ITLPDRDKILYNLHSSPLSGHFGIKKTVVKAMEHYYWSTIGRDIKNYIETCDVCQRLVGKSEKFQMTKPIKATSPFVHIEIDFVGPLEITSQGNPKETSKFLYKNIICQHGVPTIIQSDR